MILAGGTVVGLAAVAGLLRLAFQADGRAPTVPPPGPLAPVRGRKSEPEEDDRLVKARSALDRGDLITAFRACRSARVQGAPPRAVLPVEADLFRQAGYLDREIQALRQWATAAPKDATPWLKLFYIDVHLGWRHEAAEAVKRAAALAPQDPHTLVASAIWYDRARASARALPLVDQAMRLDPANNELANLRATILLRMKRHAEAESVLRRALERNPANTPDRLALAHALREQGRTAEAVAQFREVERREPDNVEAAYQLGVLAEKQGNLAEARRELERAAAADAGFSRVLFHLGRLSIRQGRVAEGKRLLRTFQRMDANALAYETAIERLEARPQDPALHYRLAQYHLRSGELPAAVVELHRVLELQSRHPAARRELIVALKRQGRQTEARRLAAGRLGI